MPARYMYWLLTAALVIVAAQFAIAGVFVVGAPLVNQQLTTSLDIASNQSRDIPVTIAGTGTGKAIVHRGELVLELTDWRAAVLKLVGVIVTGTLTITLLLLLRRFVGDVRDGRPFTPSGTTRIRTVGVLVLALPLWQVIDALLWQALVLNLMANGGPLVSTFTTAPAGRESLCILPEINFGLVFAGLILLVIGEAFRAGAMLQRDSDEIV